MNRKALILLPMALLARSEGRAADVCFAGIWDRSEPLVSEAARAVGLEPAIFAPDELIKDGPRQKLAQSCRVIFLLNIDSAVATTLAAHWPAGGVKFTVLDVRGNQAPLEKAGLLVNDPAVPKYWRPNGALNVRRLLTYAKVRYLKQPGEIAPAIDIPDFGYYDPERPDGFFAEIDAYRKFREERKRWKEGAPVAAILIQQSFWITHDTKVVDAEVAALERRGLNPVVIFGDREGMVEKLIRETRPDILVEDRHGSMWESHKLLEELDVPYLRPISMMALTVDDWRKDVRGLAYRDVGMFMALQESWGTIEPIVVGGLKTDINGFHLHEPVPDGVEKFAARAEAWVNLRRKPNAEKRVAIVYLNRQFGKGDVMQGSATGQFLDGPQSMARFLPRMKAAGYSLTRVPKDGVEVLRWALDSGRLMGPWAQKDLEAMVDRAHLPLVPLKQYLKWFNERLTEDDRNAVIKYYGPPPGRLMVVVRGGQKQIVIPRVDLGNVILMPQPERGEKQDEALLHSRDVPPPHNYLAVYWWLQDQFHADAVVHWGTHGTLELMPGKEAGLARDDWSDILVGNLPIIDLWITDNIGEAILARRRSYAQLVDHLPPPTVPAEAGAENENLRGDLAKFFSLEPGLLREQYRRSTATAARRLKLDGTLRLKFKDDKLSDAEMKRLETFVNEVAEARTPTTLHILGQPPERKYLPDYLTAALGSKYLDHLASLAPPGTSTTVDRTIQLRRQGAEFLRAHLLEAVTPAPTSELENDVAEARTLLARLDRSDEEIVGLLRALSGRYVRPGPGPDPVRNPDSAPGGRALYALNPEEIPTRQAWDVAVRLVDELLRAKPLHKVAMDLNGMDTLRDFGVMEAQILYLIGVRPVWDHNNLAIDVELISREELKRPRIDVFCAMGGHYKENFGTRVKLIDKAIRLVSGLREDGNYLREGTLRVEAKLRERGMTEEQARALAPARIFGTKPGNVSGTNILYLIPRSGAWKKDNEISDVYIDNMSYAYTAGVWGERVEGLYQDAIQNTDAIVRVWASNMTSQLGNHHAYEYMGGLSMAVTKLTGKEPDAFIADVRDPDGARMRDFNEVLATNMATELLNKKWIEGMKEHGYAGAGHTAELVKNTFGWSVTRRNAIGDQQWNDIYDVYVNDRYKLGVRKWMEDDNPHAMQEIAATLLEAARKGYWHASAESVQHLAGIYLDLRQRFGEDGGLVTGGNTDLQRFAENTAGTAPGTNSVAAGKAPDARKGAGAMALPARAIITGQRLRVVSQEARKVIGDPRVIVPLGAMCLMLIGCGYLRRWGAL